MSISAPGRILTQRRMAPLGRPIRSNIVSRTNNLSTPLASPTRARSLSLSSSNGSTVSKSFIENPLERKEALAAKPIPQYQACADVLGGWIFGPSEKVLNRITTVTNLKPDNVSTLLTSKRKLYKGLAILGATLGSIGATFAALLATKSSLVVLSLTNLALATGVLLGAGVLSLALLTRYVIAPIAGGIIRNRLANFASLPSPNSHQLQNFKDALRSAENRVKYHGEILENARIEQKVLSFLKKSKAELEKMWLSRSREQIFVRQSVELNGRPEDFKAWEDFWPNMDLIEQVYKGQVDGKGLLRSMQSNINSTAKNLRDARREVKRLTRLIKIIETQKPGMMMSLRQMASDLVMSWETRKIRNTIKGLRYTVHRNTSAVDKDPEIAKNVSGKLQNFLVIIGAQLTKSKAHKGAVLSLANLVILACHPSLGKRRMEKALDEFIGELVYPLYLARGELGSENEIVKKGYELLDEVKEILKTDLLERINYHVDQWSKHGPIRVDANYVTAVHGLALSLSVNSKVMALLEFTRRLKDQSLKAKGPKAREEALKEALDFKRDSEEYFPTIVAALTSGHI